MENTFKYAVLFCHEKSFYKDYPDFDCYDIKRNAYNFNSNIPVIAHCPCNIFSKMKGLSNYDPVYLAYAAFSIHQVRKNGGILEQPFPSDLFKIFKLPLPGRSDKYGFNQYIRLSWFGFPAIKKTQLYICGINYNDLPDIPFNMSYPSKIVAHNKTSKLPYMEKLERTLTPKKLIDWEIKILNKIKGV